MILSYPFDSVHAALVWFFNRPWLKPANYGRTSWPDGDRVQSSTKLADVELVVRAFLSIETVIARILSARDIAILSAYYRHRGETQSEVGLQYGVKTDRGVRYIRDRVIGKVEDAFIKAGVVKIKTREEPKYA